jgi:hypothetical protein
MRASDVAYLASLVERAPSNYPGKAALLDELQDIYRRAQGSRSIYRVPVTVELSVEVA